MRILHPRPELGRQRFIGVEFIDGVAVVDSLPPETEAALVQHGYTIELEAVTLESMTLAELRDAADVEGVDYPKGVSKAKLIDLINAASLQVLASTVVEVNESEEFKTARDELLNSGPSEADMDAAIEGVAHLGEKFIADSFAELQVKD